MKMIFVTVIIAGLFAEKALAAMSAEVENQMRTLIGACKTSEGASDDDLAELMSMVLPTTVTGACLHACVMETTGIIVDGQFSVDNCIAAAKQTQDDAEKFKLVTEIAIDCGTKLKAFESADRCEYAKQVAGCNIDGASAHGYLQRELLSL